MLGYTRNYYLIEYSLADINFGHHLCFYWKHPAMLQLISTILCKQSSFIWKIHKHKNVLILKIKLSKCVWFEVKRVVKIGNQHRTVSGATCEIRSICCEEARNICPLQTRQVSPPSCMLLSAIVCRSPIISKWRSSLLSKLTRIIK